MAALERRRTTSASARLTAWCVAGAFALAVQPAAVSSAAVPSLAVSSATWPGRVAPSDGGRAIRADPRLAARIRGRIAEYQERAERETKGRIKPAEVAVSVHVREIGHEAGREIGHEAGHEVGAEGGAGGGLVAIEPDRPMRPASNLKLVTTAAALVLLGPDGGFDTALETTGAVESGVLAGDLVVRAGGDPLYDPDAGGSVDALLAPALAQLRAKGVRSIQGAIVLDELDYALPSPAPGWPETSQRWSEFCALAGGFSANAGCLTAIVRAGAPGSPARVEVEPRRSGLVPRLSVTTGPARSALDVRVEARNGVVLVEGRIPKDVPEWSTRFAAPDPVELFGAVLSGALETGGIAVRDGVRRAHAPLAGRWTPLARIRTPLLSGGRYGIFLGAVQEQERREAALRYFERFRPMDVGRFATKVIDQVARNRAIIVVPAWWKLLWWLDRLSPSLYLLLAGRLVESTRRDLAGTLPQLPSG